MFSGLFKYLLTATSMAPTCLTLAFMAFINRNYCYGFSMMSVSFASFIVFYFTYKRIDKSLPTTDINVISLTPANKEITNYFLTYLFPLLGADIFTQSILATLLLLISLFFYIGFSASYHFNPLLSIVFKLNFYEITDGRNISCILLSREVLINGKIDKLNVNQVTPYMFLSKEHKHE